MRVKIVRFLFKVNVPMDEDWESSIGLDLQDFEELVNEQISDLELQGYKVLDVQFDRHRDKGTAYIKYRSPLFWFF